ncbi:MAG: KH domain-containing protein [Candidatus Hydrothermarchaeales archaeon]
MFICDICLKNEILCPGCEDKLQKGDITELEVALSKTLYKLSDTFPGLRAVELLRVIEADELVIVLTKKGHARRLVGKGGRVIKEITKEMGRKVKALEEAGDKELVEALLFPARVLRVNILYLPGEGEKFKVLVPKGDASKLLTSVTALQEALRELTGKNMVIAFE